MDDNRQWMPTDKCQQTMPTCNINKCQQTMDAKDNACFAYCSKVTNGSDKDQWC